MPLVAPPCGNRVCARHLLFKKCEACHFLSRDLETCYFLFRILKRATSYLGFLKRAIPIPDHKGMCRIVQNCIHAPYTTVYLVISLPKIPYIYTVNIWFWPTLIILINSF